MSKRFKALIDGVFRGIDASASAFVANSYVYPHASELEAMRKDWHRVGRGLKDAIKRADAQASA